MQNFDLIQALTQSRAMPDPLRRSKIIRWSSSTHAIEQWNNQIQVGVTNTTL